MRGSPESVRAGPCGGVTKWRLIEIRSAGIEELGNDPNHGQQDVKHGVFSLTRAFHAMGSFQDGIEVEDRATPALIFLDVKAERAPDLVANLPVSLAGFKEILQGAVVHTRLFTEPPIAQSLGVSSSLDQFNVKHVANTTHSAIPTSSGEY